MKDAIFSPAFGNRPSTLVGREALLETMMAGLATPPGSRERATVMLGQRGSGKTVMLWEVADRARSEGFVVASPTIASDGMLERIIEKVQDAGETHVGKGRRTVSGGSVGALGFSVGLQFTPEVQQSKSPQYKLTQLARKLSAEGVGILILVDELQANSPDVRQLVIAYQEMVGEGLDVALLMAGLPGAVSATLNDRVLTFLNRATKVELDPLPFMDVDAFFANSFERLGIGFPSDLRNRATAAVGGSPYLLQLVGHGLVSYAGDADAIDEHILEEAIAAARADFENDICRTSLMALSDIDVRFLKAMAALGTPTAIGDVAKEMGRTPDYAQKYRTRLIDAGVIRTPERGKVEFAIPYLEDHLARSGDDAVRP